MLIPKCICEKYIFEKTQIARLTLTKEMKYSLKNYYESCLVKGKPFFTKTMFCKREGAELVLNNFFHEKYTKFSKNFKKSRKSVPTPKPACGEGSC